MKEDLQRASPDVPEPAMLRAELSSWLERFAACVRERRYADARAQFSDDVIGFGTTARRVVGLSALEREQWRPIWETTSDFRFEMSELASFEGTGGLVVAVPFSSVGYDAASRPFARHGRATLVFIRVPAGLLAVHSHFSLDPEERSSDTR